MSNIVEGFKHGLILMRDIFYKIVFAIMKPIVYLDTRIKYAILIVMVCISIMLWVYFYTQRKQMLAVVCN